MLRLNRIIIVYALLLLSVKIAFAQSDSVMQLGGFLDQQASANSLPIGDGAVSPVEQSVASALIDEITGFSQSVADFQQASPSNKSWLDQVEQRAATYDQQQASAEADAPVDIRAQMISDAVAQYGNDIAEVQSQGTFDIRAQIISDAVAQYGRDAATLQTEAPTDPRAEAISYAVSQYGQQLDALQAQSAPDPRAEAISYAVSQYGKEVANAAGQPLSSSTIQAILNTLSEGTRQYINRSNLPRKILIIKHIDDMIPGDFDDHPNEQLEVLAGYWRRTPSATTITGECKSAAMGFGSNPDGGSGSEPTPVVPLVPIYESIARDFLFIDDRPYGFLQPKVYGRSSSERQLVMQNGATSGSINITNTTEYRVVASDLIAERRIYKEEGGCTIETTARYELVQTDPGVMHETPEDKATPQPIDTPVATLQPTTAPLPIPPATYPITWTVDSGTCTDKTKPTFTQAVISYTNNGDMLLRLGEDQHTLFAVGDLDNPRYQLISPQRQITVQVLGGVIKMDWGKFAGTAMCFKSGDLGTGTTAPSAPDSTAIPTQTPVAASGNQQYQVSFQPDASMCPKDIQTKLPAFDGATFEAFSDGSYQLAVDGQTLTFKDQYGYAVYDGSEPSKGITYQISAQVSDQGGMLGLTYMNASGQMCLGQMTLSAK